MSSEDGKNLALLLCCFLMAECGQASQKKTSCHIQGNNADCSRLSLKAVPANLPGNITSLDMSHNRLDLIPPSSLAPYAGLLHLNVSYNSISRLDRGLCHTLPVLQTLNLDHNQVSVIGEEDVHACSSLTRFLLSSNKLKLKGEPFSGLQRLKFLDVSKNNLNSARLGSKPQMDELEELSLAFNKITTLAKDDFALLKHSNSFKVLNLASSTIKTVEPGSFKPISQLNTLIMDGSNMGTTVISKLCSELSGTSIKSLSLQRMKLVTLTNATLKGLRQTNLSFLDLSGNGMGKIENYSFQWTSKLETLILSDNNIKHLTMSTFEGLKSLKNLVLIKALVKSHTSSTPIIDDFSFRPLSSLESLSLRQTSAREITEHTFTGLESLKELDMSWGSYVSLKTINKMTLISLGGSPLLELNLTATGIGQIQPGAFSHLKNLTSIALDFNFIKQTLTGKEFEGLDQLRELNMSFNHQTINLSSRSFVSVPNLKVLTLAKSLMVTALNLDPSPFKPLSKVTYLDLSNNNIANIHGNLLDGLVNLQVLKLQHNNLAKLWKDANLGGPMLYLKGLENLLSLQMDSNGLDEIPTRALSGLTNLQELSLSNNLLNNLKDPVFEGLTSLKVLHLHRNMITAVRPEVFRTPLSNLSLLIMGRNPFDCTCESILWFVTWLNNTNTTSVPGLRDQYMCNTPMAYFNHSVMDFKALFCKDMTPFQALYILSSTLVVLLTVTALLMRFHGWRVQFYWNILINRALGFSDARVEEGRQFEYDAYVIHAEENTDWVERAMKSLESESCRFCVDHRDLVPGMSQLESIVDNMRNSRKILFVVTENLLSDPWCSRFKAHHALHQVIEASRDSVILVFLQDVHDYKLSRSLFLRRGMLRPRCVLHWPVQRERVPAFYQKLRIALGLTNQFHS
ncbi:toll-like receptor 3 isoform X1 [Dunckerocampus dactyliophorus]|uniref:toll-like receptor 3 isoform X1 n=2 Tax=Dunckerocampus dactyliophorus TaxID=161453 RepID=UPI00240701C9|nr:toll-like receptor 3 isoform X1 [Dunckerocampus dactyliophorus]XP_054636130.1 toll-like receptor 3 isoform X1 [Dunckerocampus dactyliophorus]